MGGAGGESSARFDVLGLRTRRLSALHADGFDEGVILPIYLLDAVVELAFIVGWAVML